jgi:hypothetical protein
MLNERQGYATWVIDQNGNRQTYYDINGNTIKWTELETGTILSFGKHRNSTGPHCIMRFELTIRLWIQPSLLLID